MRSIKSFPICFIDNFGCEKELFYDCFFDTMLSKLSILQSSGMMILKGRNILQTQILFSILFQFWMVFTFKFHFIMEKLL